MNDLTIVALMAFILLALVASIPLYDKYSEYSGWKKFFVTTCVVLLFLIGCIDVYFRTTDDTPSKILSGIKELLDDKQKPTKIIVKPIVTPASTTSKATKFAFLRFSTKVLNNPVILKTNKEDSLQIKYWLTNYATADAYNLGITTILIAIINNKLIAQDKIQTTRFDKSVKIYADKSLMRPGGTSVFISKPYVDSMFFCLKTDFDDGSNIRKSFTKIYKVSFDRFEFTEVEDTVHSKIVNYLIKKRYWKPPFNQ